jgi:glycosyltransferase involved in cell wall biosynthesis
MLPGIPKISVYIITYNQEDVIERTLSSVLSQIDYVYEICVSDDCSSDRTWEILQEYSHRYPGLFKLNRNVSNLGIFENTEKVWTMPTGDIVHDLAGDDCVGEGWFKRVIGYIQANHIDYKNELFCIYGDYKCIFPNGDEIVMYNDGVEKTKGKLALKMALRGVICNRSTCFSINILKNFVTVSKGRSHIAEDAQDRQLQIFSTNNYYIPYIGNVYYSGIGVSTHVNDLEIIKERLQIREYAFELFEKWHVSIDEKDKIYSLEFLPNYNKLRLKFSLFLFLKTVYLFIKAKDKRIPHSKNSRIKLISFAIKRRLPHMNIYL